MKGVNAPEDESADGSSAAEKDVPGEINGGTKPISDA